MLFASSNIVFFYKSFELFVLANGTRNYKEECIFCGSRNSEGGLTRNMKSTAIKNCFDTAKSIKNAELSKKFESAMGLEVITVHDKCRSLFQVGARTSLERPVKSLESSSEISVSPLSLICLICGKDASDEYIKTWTRKSIDRREEGDQVVKITQDDFARNFIKKVYDKIKCDPVREPEIANTLRRIKDVECLATSQARYHRKCFRYYDKLVPAKKRIQLSEVFDKFFKHIEDQEENNAKLFYRVREIQRLVSENDFSIDFRTFENFLESQLENNKWYIMRVPGEGQILILKDKMNEILIEKYSDHKLDESQKVDILQSKLRTRLIKKMRLS